MNTNELIASLSTELPKSQLCTPVHYGVRVMTLLFVYGMGAQLVLGLRTDLVAQFNHPFFVLEIVLLALLTGLSTWSAILSMYPDMYQKRGIPNLPYAVFALLTTLIFLQLIMPYVPVTVSPQLSVHDMECALCIASISIIPSALIFRILRKGASIHALRSGSFAGLAAAGIGCLTLRLAEANDSLMHLAGWHYLPTLLFAMLGAWIGKVFLKW
jgi:hypothetical protein